SEKSCRSVARRWSGLSGPKPFDHCVRSGCAPWPDRSAGASSRRSRPAPRPRPARPPPPSCGGVTREGNCAESTRPPACRVRRAELRSGDRGRQPHLLTLEPPRADRDRVAWLQNVVELALDLRSLAVDGPRDADAAG